MKYHIEHHARTYSITFRNDESEWDCENFSTFDEAFAYAEAEIDERQQALSAVIWDGDTGEVYATCWWDEESIPEEDYGPQDIELDDNYWDDGCPVEDWGYNEDEGFDPYLGEYTWDC